MLPSNPAITEPPVTGPRPQSGETLRGVRGTVAATPTALGAGTPTTLVCTWEPRLRTPGQRTGLVRPTQDCVGVRA